MSELRQGQQEFNDLYAKHPKIADEIRGTIYDPFFRDSILPAFRKKVAELLAIEKELG